MVPSSTLKTLESSHLDLPLVYSFFEGSSDGHQFYFSKQVLFGKDSKMETVGSFKIHSEGQTKGSFRLSNLKKIIKIRLGRFQAICMTENYSYVHSLKTFISMIKSVLLAR